MGYPQIHAIAPDAAGRRLARLAADHDFVLFEFWKTDKAGHAKDMKEAVLVLELFDAFLGGLIDSLDTSDTLLFITSDHGNLEDLTTKAHTRNMVPALLYGLGHDEVARKLGAGSSQAGSLVDVTPALIDAILQN